MFMCSCARDTDAKIVRSGPGAPCNTEQSFYSLMSTKLTFILCYQMFLHARLELTLFAARNS